MPLGLTSLKMICNLCPCEIFGYIMKHQVQAVDSLESGPRRTALRLGPDFLFPSKAVASQTILTQRIESVTGFLRHHFRCDKINSRSFKKFFSIHDRTGITTPPVDLSRCMLTNRIDCERMQSHGPYNVGKGVGWGG